MADDRKDLTQDDLTACLEECRALNKAYRKQIRSLVGVALRRRKLKDEGETLDYATEHVIRMMRHL